MEVANLARLLKVVSLPVDRLLYAFDDTIKNGWSIERSLQQVTVLIELYLFGGSQEFHGNTCRTDQVKNRSLTGELSQLLEPGSNGARMLTLNQLMRYKLAALGVTNADTSFQCR